MNGYLEAIGGRLRLTVEFGGTAIDVDLATLGRTEAATTSSDAESGAAAAS
jgi:hypothetical protein